MSHSSHDTPYGAAGCRCWIDGVDYTPDTEPRWQPNAMCPHHGVTSSGWDADTGCSCSVNDPRPCRYCWRVQAELDAHRIIDSGEDLAAEPDDWAPGCHPQDCCGDPGAHKPATCTRRAPHLCRVNGPCNGLPKDGVLSLGGVSCACGDPDGPHIPGADGRPVCTPDPYRWPCPRHAPVTSGGATVTCTECITTEEENDGGVLAASKRFWWRLRLESWLAYFDFRRRLR